MILSNPPLSNSPAAFVDPMVAEGISATKPAHRSDTHAASQAPNHARTPKYPSRQHPKLTQSLPKNLSRKSPRKRNNSMRNVKNSNELLRQRSIHARGLHGGSDGSSTMKEGGRHFTVSNVGVGGMIYLRPSANQPQQLQPLPSFIFPPPTPPPSAPLESSNQWENLADPRQSNWSSSQMSHRPPRHLLQRFTTDSSRNSTPYTPYVRSPRPGHLRARSSSTLDDQGESEDEIDDGALRIVINRSTIEDPNTIEERLPTLQVPIPHYRLGTPRFSAQGTPILRSSVYTRASTAVSEDMLTPDVTRRDLLFPAPPGSDAKGVLIRQGSDMSLNPSHAGSDDAPNVFKSCAVLASPAIDSASKTIGPTLFDAMAEMQDDPSVVRYSPKNGEITAATPARIIAQISSEAFMDYELVSDFFLTFRLYLSTEKLLGLLLARLRWAINRLEDDGRVIRIRTFAALRHWILNYFMDDFVGNRALRIQFCDQINDMYREVSARTTGGISDLKILQDLKRCWNGRCLLYWDSAEFFIDSHQKADIVPGGVDETRESNLDQPRTAQLLRPWTRQRQSRTQKEILHSWFGDPPENKGLQPPKKHVPTSAVDEPRSPISVQSLQPGSCSIPAKILKRSPPAPGHAKEPHPVPVQQQATPSHHQPTSLGPHRPRGHAHKRSGSFSDSIRLRGSTGLGGKQVVVMLPQSGSLIRGNVYLPRDPYVDVVAPASPPTQHHRYNSTLSGSTAPTDAASRYNVQPGPGVRTIFGSIRRALSGKQGPTYAPPKTAGSQKSDHSLQGKTSALPLNISRSNDPSGGKGVGPEPRSNTRIDLLCAAISQRYKIAQEEASDHEPAANPGIGIALGDGVAQSSLSPNMLHLRPHEQEATQRMASHVTARSGSIVIMDDTGVDLSTISGGSDVPFAYHQKEVGPANTVIAPSPAVNFISQHALPDEAVPYNPSQRSSGALGRRRSSSVGRGVRLARRVSSQLDRAGSTRYHRDKNPSAARSVSLGRSPMLRSSEMTLMTPRGQAFKQSSPVRPGQRREPSGTTASYSREDHSGDIGTGVEGSLPAPVLRRRPGGDLRRIQNVHDLEPHLQHESSGSATTGTDSFAGSMLIMGNRRLIGSENPKVATTGSHPVSLIRTHSSQNLRPSFEAALAGFSSIPDDGDGGLEATLLKLEGRYEKQSPEFVSEVAMTENRRSSVSTKILDLSPHETPRGEEKMQQRILDVQQDLTQAFPLPPAGTVLWTSRQQTTASNTTAPNDNHSRDLLAELDLTPEEYSHVPVPHGGSLNASVPRQKLVPHAKPTGLTGSFFNRDYANIGEPPSELPHASIEGAESSVNSEKRSKQLALPKRDTSPTAESFLLDEDEDLSDLSSELSVDVIENFEIRNRTMSPLIAAPGTAISGLEIPTHPLAHPPSPSFTLEDLLTSAPVNPLPYSKMPPTPDYSPTQPAHHDDSKDSFTELMHLSVSGPTKSPELAAVRAGHIPFVLAHESEILAQQFTLVEKAALSEVDWNDLVEMRWDNKSTNHLNWVEYLATKDDKGIDVVITRFNLMVKWVLSEIVLTQDIDERARTITKFIHVAAHSRRLHNYATMLQMTIALTSVDCTRLKKTWELVQPPERSLLKNMETLIQPVKNFHDLRVEMETANLLDGCIPFVGLYIHDLTYNAQKPAQIASTRDSEPLVNFERYRTAATVVKGLLRLIDASSQYNFPPVEGIIERCLWVAALSDDRIQALSKALD